MTRCLDCRFFLPKMPEASERRAGAAPRGECRKNPPTVVKADGTAAWPFLRDANEAWCGAFVQADKEATIH